jgi:flagellar protein FliJ
VTRQSEHSLAMLAKVKRDEEDVAAQQLRAARDRLDAELERLKAVRRYADDYRGHGTGELTHWRNVLDGRRFLLQLELTIEAQRAAIERERNNVEAARAHWLALRLQRAAVDKLIDRRAEAARHEERRSEQRQSDEQAARASLRLSEEPGV